MRSITKTSIKLMVFRNCIYITKDAADSEQIGGSPTGSSEGANVEEERWEGSEEWGSLEYLLGKGSSSVIQKQPLNEDGSEKPNKWIGSHKYVGDWKDNQKDGFGIQYYSNGDKY